MKKTENKATRRDVTAGRSVPVKRARKAGIGITTLKKAGGSVMVTVPAHVRRGLKLAVGDNVDDAYALGFLIADKQAGAFRLEIAWIKAGRFAGQ